MLKTRRLFSFGQSTGRISLLLWVALAFALQTGRVSAEPPLPSQLRSSFWALPTALADYQMDNDQRFPPGLADIKPYLNEGWRKSELIETTLFVQDFSGQSLYDIPMKTLKGIPVFVQTRKSSRRSLLWVFL